jgi:hypothetical protein
MNSLFSYLFSLAISIADRVLVYCLVESYSTVSSSHHHHSHHSHHSH